MSAPRGIEERIDWFLSHKPSGSGMCAQHTWHSLGGNNGNPPAWGCSDANECVDKVKKSGRYWTPATWDGPPPRGAWVGWKYGSNGHAALSNGDGKITTTDPSNGKPTGTEPLDYPKRWGFNDSSGDYTVWTDQYNGVRFEVGAAVAAGDVYLSKLVYGQMDSDSVSRLQTALNGHKLEGGHDIDVTGNYLDQTDTEVRLCQAQHGFGSDPAGASFVGAAQADHLFAGTGNTIIDDLPDGTPPPEPEEPPAVEQPPEEIEMGYFHDYSGKPSGTLTVVDGDGYVALDAKCKPAPFSGAEFHMIYINAECTWDASGDDGVIRVRYTRDAFGGEPADDTGYQDYTVPKGEALGDPDGFLITATHWEAGQAGRGGRWYVRCDGALKKIVIGTRYAKVVVVS